MKDRAGRVRPLNPYAFNDTDPHFIEDGVIRAPHSVCDRWIRRGETFNVQGRTCWADGEPYGFFYRSGVRMAQLHVRSQVAKVIPVACIWCAEPATKGRFCDECFPHRRKLLALIPS